MGKSKRKRQKQQKSDEHNKKRKLNPEEKCVESTDLTEECPTPSMEAAPVDLTDVDEFNSRCAAWIQDQMTYDADELLAQLDTDSGTEQNPDGNEWQENLEVPLREGLKNYTDDEKRKTFKYECEWKKCSYLSGKDFKYFRHIENHAEMAKPSKHGSFECAWDLCDFRTTNHQEFLGHVHFHGYHTKLKMHGASLAMLMKFPNCNYDSRTRNSIATWRPSYNCEWDQCDEKFNKAMDFFHHVQNHLLDLFPVDFTKTKKDKENRLCRWSICKYKLISKTNAIKHSRTHTTEKDVACFNCGATFYERVKLRDHCSRQIDLMYRKHQCPQCDKFYATKRLLINHLDSHIAHHNCTMCPLAFCTAALLSRHFLRRHLRQRNFECNKCDYRCFLKSDLNTHNMIVHSTNSIFRCDEFGCNASFKREAYLKKHISEHYNGFRTATYACHLCKEQYREAHYLSKHLAFVHNVEKQPGHTRYRYAADIDGIFRFKVFLDAQRKLRWGAISEKPMKGGSCENVAEGVAEEQINDAASPNIVSSKKTKTKINKITAIAANEFAIELGLDWETEEQVTAPAVQQTPNQQEKQNKSRTVDPVASNEDSQLAVVKGEKKTTKQKKVQDFTVMQRYLKTGKLRES